MEGMRGSETGEALPGRKKGRRGKALALGALAVVTGFMVAAVALAFTVDTVKEDEGETSAWATQEEGAGSKGSASEALFKGDADRAAGVSSSGTSSNELPDIQPRVIRTGKITLELEKGLFQEKRGEVYFLVESAGGYVQSENTGESSGATRGTFLLRVPADRFDQVFLELSRLGKPISSEVAAQDVTEEYIDLEGRIRHLEAEEQFYLGLIAQARTVQEMISIRERLDSVQLQKEQALGRKNYLDKQISYSLITLNLAEAIPESVSNKGFWGRIGEAFKSFGRACRELAVGLAYALPYLAALALLILLVMTALRKRRGRENAAPGS